MSVGINKSNIKHTHKFLFNNLNWDASGYKWGSIRSRKKLFIFSVLSKPRMSPRRLVSWVTGVDSSGESSDWGNRLPSHIHLSKRPIIPLSCTTLSSSAYLRTANKLFFNFSRLRKKAFVVELFPRMNGLRKIQKLTRRRSSGQETKLWYIARAAKQGVQVKL